MPRPTPQVQTWTDLIRSYAPIERVEETSDGHLLVTGYCFVNAKAGDGWNLKRSTMEAATPEYLQNGSIREMHRKDSAAGTPLEAIWDEKGCLLRALVVDPVAIDKVKTKTYKGFSVGVAPKIVRGKDVERALWIENSLVDRPQDSDAKIDSFEILHSEDAGKPFEVEIYDEDADLEEIIRAAKPLSYADMRGHEDNVRSHSGSDQMWSDLHDGIYRLRSVLAGISGSSVSNKPELMQKSLDQFRDHMTPILCGDPTAAERALNDLLITRKEEAPVPIDLADITRLMQEGGDPADELRRAILGPEIARLDAVETAIAGVATQITEAITPVVERVDKLAKAPAHVHLPVLNVAAVERTFAANNTKPNEASPLRQKYDEICRSIKTERDDDRRSRLISERYLLKNQLRQAGEDVE